MNIWRLFVLFLVSLSSLTALAAVRYVDAGGAGPVPPYASWATAATNIQDAVDAATTGDTVLVTNGIYRYGGKNITELTNRVLITNAIIVQSINGPQVTVIEGYRVPGVGPSSSA